MKPSKSSNSPSPATSAEKVRNLLNAKQWRKARDEAKLGCKADRTAFLPLLIEANVGLAREMIAKKLISEAEQVLAYLATIAPQEVVNELREEMAGQKTAQQGSSAPARPQAPGPVRPPTLDEISVHAVTLSSGGEIPVTEWSRIDAWVADALARNLPALKDGEPQVSQDLVSVCHAVEAVGSGRFVEAQDLLRPLSLRSVLQHWKSFLRAVIFTHLGEKEKALRGFKTLGASVALSRASAPYLSLLRAPLEAAIKPSDEQFAFGLLAISGGDAGWAGSVAKAESHWSKGEASRAYHALRKGTAKGAFPTIASNVAGTLTDLIFSTGDMDDERRNQLLGAVLSTFPQALDRPKEALAMLRWIMLNLEFVDEAHIARLFEHYVRLWKAEGGLQPETEALTHVWMAEQWADEMEVPSRFGPPGSTEYLVRNPKGAQAEFEKAIRLQPNRARPYLGLCRVLDRLGEKAKRQKLLDEMCERFVDDKNVLLLAGREALGLKSYSKALATLEKALRLDPLDTELLDDMVLARVGMMVTKSSKGSDDGWAAVEPMLVDEAKAQVRSRWCMRVIQGASLARGNSAGIREEGCRMAPHPSVANYFERLFCLSFNLPVPKDNTARWKAAVPSITCETIIHLWEVVEYWVQRRSSPCKMDQAMGPLEVVMATMNLKAAPAEGVLLLAETLASRASRSTKDDRLKEGCDYLIFLLYDRHLSKALKAKKSDPRLRLAAALLDDLRAFRGTPYEPAPFLQRLMEDATKTKLPHVAERARKLLHKFQSLPPLPPIFFDEPPFDIEMLGFDDDDGDAPSPSNEELRGFMDIILQIKAAHPREVADLRKKVIKEGVMPVATFDMLVEFAKHASMEELAEMMMETDEEDDVPPSGRRPTKGKARRSASNPDQLNLF